MGTAGPETPGVRVLPPLIFAATLALGFLLHWIWPAAIIPGKVAVLRVAGLLLVTLGVVLSAVSVRLFRRAGTNVNPRRPTTALVQTGPYRISRNPMYVALVVLTAGIALLANAWGPLFLLVPALVAVRYGVIAQEERYLEAKFGGAYREYTSRVRRWL